MPLKQTLWKKPKCFRTLPLVEQEESSSSRHQVEQKFVNLPTSTAASASLHHPVRGVEGERRTRSWWQITSQLPCRRLFFSPSWRWVRAAEADDDQRCGSRQRAGLLSMQSALDLPAQIQEHPCCKEMVETSNTSSTSGDIARLVCIVRPNREFYIKIVYFCTKMSISSRMFQNSDVHWPCSSLFTWGVVWPWPSTPSPSWEGSRPATQERRRRGVEGWQVGGEWQGGG